MALYQKYRPQKFSDLIGQDHIAKTLLEAIKRERLTHAYLLAGPRGTGKTTTARLLAKAINCQSRPADSGEPCGQCQSCKSITAGNALDIIEIDAASHTGVDDVREIIDKARLAPLAARKKIYIIDEVHMLSKSAFNALLKTLEEPPPHVVFILATTEASRLPETILSRTQRYDFHRVALDDIVQYLRRVAGAEQIEIDEESLHLMARLAHGGHRDAVGLLEQVGGYTRKISLAEAEVILGLSTQREAQQYLRAIFNRSSEEGLKIAHRLYEQGNDLMVFNCDVIELLREILLVKAGSDFALEEGKDKLEQIKTMADLVEVDELIGLIKIFLAAGQLQREMANQVLAIEMATIEACQHKLAKSPPPAESKIEDREIAATLKPVEKSVPADKTILPTEEKMPVPVVEMTLDLWDKVVQAVKKENSTLAALLRDTKPLQVEDGKIVLGVKFQFHKDKISEHKNLQILERIIKELTGSKGVVNCRLLSPKPKKPAEPNLSENDLQKAVEEVFDIAS